MSAAPTPSAAATPKAPSFNHANLVFNIDVFLLAIVCVFFLLSLPRAVVRFSHAAEWFDGVLLRRVPVRARRYPDARDDAKVLSPESAFLGSNYNYAAHGTSTHDGETSSSQAGSTSAGTDMSWLSDSEKYMDAAGYSSASHAVLARSGSSSSQAYLLRKYSTSSGRATRNARGRLALPTHMPDWTTMLPSLSWITRTSVGPGLTVGSAAILVAYAGVMVYGATYKSNLLTQPMRTGYLAASQIPVVVLLGTKVNVLGILLGAAYTRLNLLHRFAGRILVLACNIHAFSYLYQWSFSGTLTQHLTQGTHTHAFLALLSIDLLYLSSLRWLRLSFFSTFHFLHILSFTLFLLFTALHAPLIRPYIYCTLALYGADRLGRVVKTRVGTASVEAVREMGMTRVEVRGVNGGWRAGQHVRLRVLSLGMGWLGWTECHPFTVASVSRSPNGDGLVLYCKKTGLWTTRLFDLARRAEYGGLVDGGRDVRVMVEGPYGGPQHTLYSSFSGALVFAGGSGITYALGVVQDLIQKDVEGRSRLKCVELVWSVQDPAAVLPLLPLFTSMLAQSSAKPHYATLNISISYTRCFSSSSSSPTSPSSPLQKLPPGLTITPGRPKLQAILTSVVDRACMLFHGGRENRGAPSGVFVATCGPRGLSGDVRRAVRAVDEGRRGRAGGVELHDEVFGA